MPHLVVVSLDHFQEYRGPILDRLGEDLEQISVVVEIYQDVQVLKMNNSKTSKIIVIFMQSILSFLCLLCFP